MVDGRREALLPRDMRLFAAATMFGVTALLAGCSSAPTEPGTPTEDSHGFVVLMSGTNPVLIAPENAGAGTEPLVGVVALVGTCIGVTAADGSAVTVVWPHGTLALQSRVGLEVPSNSQYDLPQARFGEASPIQLQGGFFADTSWIDQIPAECPVPESGVFVVSNAMHPAPA